MQIKKTTLIIGTMLGVSFTFLVETPKNIHVYKATGNITTANSIQYCNNKGQITSI